jgi:putative transposase
MRENGLKARRKRRFKRTTDSDHAWPIAPNIIDQDFCRHGTEREMGRAHLLCLVSRVGWLYLAVIIDLFSRKIVGWAVGDCLHRDLALAALRKSRSGKFICEMTKAELLRRMMLRLPTAKELR